MEPGSLRLATHGGDSDSTALDQGISGRRVLQLSGLGDPIYCEAVVTVCTSLCFCRHV